MWESIKQFFTTASQSKPSVLETAFLSQSKAIEKIMAKQQELIVQQQNTLDRIVTSKFDRPIALPAQTLAPDSMPDWAMNDQGDVRPDEMQAAINSLTIDSDAEFLKAVGAQ